MNLACTSGQCQPQIMLWTTQREKTSDSSSPREPSQAPKSSENSENFKPADNANAFANANHENSQSSSYIEAARTISAKDFTEVHKKPCVRESLLTGLGVGFGVAGIRSVLGGLYGFRNTAFFSTDLYLTASILTSCNWATGAFIISSLIRHDYCRRMLAAEKHNMNRIKEGLERKRIEVGKKEKQRNEAAGK